MHFRQKLNHALKRPFFLEATIFFFFLPFDPPFFSRFLPSALKEVMAPLTAKKRGEEGGRDLFPPSLFSKEAESRFPPSLRVVEKGEGEKRRAGGGW